MGELYPRLALQNIRRGRQFYLPYLLTVLATCAAFYLVLALNRQSLWPDKARYAYLSAFMTIGSLVIALFAAVFLTYTGRFLSKRRQRELGLYNILGMGKGHIALILGYEALFLAVAGIGGGLLAGMVLQGVFTALLSALMGMPPIFSPAPSPAGAVATAGLFAAILLGNLVLDLARLKLQKPVELLRESAVGEREPRTRWLLALAGLATLGGGYAIAVTAPSAADALVLYFPAVLLVILGTYCLFTAGSVAVLKLLKKNRRFYYQTTHFIGLSGMLYRMKRNAVGLANICVLCTMVLVMTSGTLTLYLGSEELIPKRYPGEVTVCVVYDPAAERPLDQAELDRRFALCAQRWGYPDARELDQTACAALWLTEVGEGVFQDGDPAPGLSRFYFYLMPYETYERRTGLPLPHDGAAHIYREGGWPWETLTLDFGGDDLACFPVGQPLEAIPDVISALLYVGSNDCYVALPEEALAQLSQLRAESGRGPLSLTRSAYWDLGGDPGDYATVLRAFYGENWTGLGQYDRLFFQDRESFAQEYYALNSGFFFLGVFLGSLFLLATALILYYKQLVEGYEDQARYHILRAVGMDRATIRRSVNGQLLVVFFAPLLVSGVHLVFHFPLVRRLLTLFGVYDLWLELACALGALGLFLLLYAGMYRLTARAYARIVG